MGLHAHGRNNAATRPAIATEFQRGEKRKGKMSLPGEYIT